MRAALALLVALLLTAGCAQTPDNLFVLLEPPGGGKSSIVVSNAGGQVVLDQPGQATGMNDAKSAPIAPIELKPETVDKVFGRTLAAVPEKPISFILYFRPDTAELNPESRARLADIVRTVTERRFPVVDVVGHTDRTGERAFNYTLGLKRAEAMRDVLVKAGIDPAMIKVTSHGEDNPLVPTKDDVSARRNRRVEITVR